MGIPFANIRAIVTARGFTLQKCLLDDKKKAAKLLSLFCRQSLAHPENQLAGSQLTAQPACTVLTDATNALFTVFNESMASALAATPTAASSDADVEAVQKFYNTLLRLVLPSVIAIVKFASVADEMIAEVDRRDNSERPPTLLEFCMDSRRKPMEASLDDGSESSEHDPPLLEKIRNQKPKLAGKVRAHLKSVLANYVKYRCANKTSTFERRQQIVSLFRQTLLRNVHATTLFMDILMAAIEAEETQAVIQASHLKITFSLAPEADALTAVDAQATAGSKNLITFLMSTDTDNASLFHTNHVHFFPTTIRENEFEIQCAASMQQRLLEQ